MGETMISKRRSIWTIKGLLRVIALVGVVGLSLVGTVESRGTKLFHTGTTSSGRGTTSLSSQKGNLKHYDDGVITHPKKMDINYTSKRKVPNGSDPIHNRRARNSRQPPGQA